MVFTQYNDVNVNLQASDFRMQQKALQICILHYYNTAILKYWIITILLH